MKCVLVALSLAILVVPVSAQVDTTSPQITLDIVPPPNANGWNSRTVTLNATATDDSSGVAGSPVQSFMFFSNGVNQGHTFTFFDNAGNCGQLIVGDGAPDPGCAVTRVPGINIDQDNPVVTVTPARQPNAAGWYNFPVNFHFAAFDGLSGIDTNRSPEIVDIQSDPIGIRDYTQRFYDRAGNIVEASITAKVDPEPPRFDVVVTPTPINGAWNSTDAQITVTVHQFLSGVGSFLVDGAPVAGDTFTTSFTTEGRHPVSIQASSVAGTFAGRTEFVNIDKTPPVVTYQLIPPANQAGWNRSDVIVRYIAVDNLSGVICPTGVCAGTTFDVGPITREGQNIPVSSPTFSDLARNSARLPEPTVSLDKTPPVVTITQSPVANANGWNNTDVNVHFAVSDNLSGPTEGPLDFNLTQRGGNFAQHRYFDVAGNFIDVLRQVKIDKDPPNVIGTFVTPFPTSSGWNNSDVEVQFFASATSGIVGGSPVKIPFSGEGANLHANTVITSFAGNSVNAERILNIDKHGPVVTSHRTPDPNPYGWNNSDVTVQFDATDSLSGVDGPSTRTSVISTEGKNQGAFMQFADFAGNVTSASLGGISIDKTPPSISCFATPALLWPPNRQMVPVSIGFSFYDGDEYTPGMSGGPANGYTLTSLARSVPKDGDVAGFIVGSQISTGQLLAWRAAQLPSYTFGYAAMDFAGNVGNCTTQVSVGR